MTDNSRRDLIWSVSSGDCMICSIQPTANLVSYERLLCLLTFLAQSRKCRTFFILFFWRSSGENQVEAITMLFKFHNYISNRQFRSFLYNQSSPLSIINLFIPRSLYHRQFHIQIPSAPLCKVGHQCSICIFTVFTANTHINHRCLLNIRKHPNNLTAAKIT